MFGMNQHPGPAAKVETKPSQNPTQNLVPIPSSNKPQTVQGPPPIPGSKQPNNFTDMYNKQMGKTTDKAVDNLYAN